MSLNQLSGKFDKKYFNTGAYRNYQKFVLGWAKPVGKKIAAILSQPGLKILEVGCAHGYLLAELQNKYGLDVRGIDLSSFAVSNAEKSVRGKIKQGDILKLKAKENSFDVIIFFDVINYLTREKAKQVIAKLVKISKKYIFFSAIFRHARNASQKFNPDKFRISCLSKKEYQDLFEKRGAKLIKKFMGENGGEILVFIKK